MVSNDKKYNERPSPPYHAKEFPDKIKKGNDGNKYISKKDKNGIYKWYVVKKTKEIKEPSEKNKKKISLKKTAEEYFQQFPNYTKPLYNTNIFTKNLEVVKAELRKIGVNFYFVKWHKWSTGPFEVEYWYEDNVVSKNYILYFEKKLFFDARSKEGIMYLYFGVDKTLWSDVNDILKKYFPNRTNGITTINDAIKIFFEEKKRIVKDKEKIIVNIVIYFKDKKLNDEVDKYLKIINKIIGKKIGYINQYDMGVSHGRLNIEYNINKDKIDEFKKLIDTLKNNKSELPQITKINIQTY